MLLTYISIRWADTDSLYGNPTGVTIIITDIRKIIKNTFDFHIGHIDIANKGTIKPNISNPTTEISTAITSSGFWVIPERPSIGISVPNNNFNIYE